MIADIKLHDLTEGHRTVGAYYFATGQRNPRNLTFAVRTPGDPSTLGGGVRRVMSELDRELPLFDTLSLEERLEK